MTTKYKPVTPSVLTFNIFYIKLILSPLCFFYYKRFSLHFSRLPLIYSKEVPIYIIMLSLHAVQNVARMKTGEKKRDKRQRAKTDFAPSSLFSKKKGRCMCVCQLRSKKEGRRERKMKQLDSRTVFKYFKFAAEHSKKERKKGRNVRAGYLGSPVWRFNLPFLPSLSTFLVTTWVWPPLYLCVAKIATLAVSPTLLISSSFLPAEQTGKQIEA